MKTINYLLGYKNLHIVQDPDMFKFSLDSVLLANFVVINKNTERILDIGTGNAPVPLILSTRTKAHIKGIEIQKDVALMASESVLMNHLNDQIEIINDDVKNYYKNEDKKYDIITCNPPFFKVSEGSNTNLSEYKTIARHEVCLNLEELIKISKSLLKTNGSLVMVHRPDRLVDILTLMRASNIEPKRIQFIYPKKGEQANMLLIEGSLNGKPSLKLLDPLYIYDEAGNYTSDVKKLFEDIE